jgi:hypothetical protein
MNKALPVPVRDFVLHLHQDLVNLTPGLFAARAVKRDRRWLRELTDWGPLLELPAVGKLLDAYLATGATDVLCEVVSRLGGKFSYWLEPGLSPTNVRALRQMLLLFAKLDLGEPYGDEVYNDFIARNRSLPCSVPEFPEARAIASLCLGNLDLRDILPKHGPGATATKEKPWQKMNFRRIYRTMDTLYPFCDYFFLNYDHLCDELSSLEQLQELDYPTTRLVAVPKDFRGPRLISAEPLETMWIQQGQARMLMDQLERHPLTRGYVNFSSQDVNRSLARASSINGEYVTIDLKDASDRVSLALAREILPRSVYTYLEASRSRSTLLPSGMEEELRMFAPMGSACCFPVESIIFYSLALGAICRCTGTRTPPTMQQVMRCLGTVYTYGDDLIVRAEYLQCVLSALQSAGLVINTNKTCVGTHFRESCGADFFDGVDVAPVRIKSIPSRHTPETFPSACSYINQLLAKGYQGAAAQFERLTVTEFGPVPRSSYPEPCTVFTPFRSEVIQHNAVFPHRWNPAQQRTEYRIRVTVPRKKFLDQLGWCEVFRTLTCGSDPSGLNAYAIPHSVVLTQRWKAL